MPGALPDGSVSHLAAMDTVTGRVNHGAGQYRASRRNTWRHANIRSEPTAPNSNGKAVNSHYKCSRQTQKAQHTGKPREAEWRLCSQTAKTRARRKQKINKKKASAAKFSDFRLVFQGLFLIFVTL